MNASERKEAASEILGELNEEEVPILVEGARDRSALRSLGTTSPIVLVGNSRGIVALAERLQREGVERVIVLVDWDRTGGHLARLLSEILPTHGIAVNLEYRRELGRLLRKICTSVEEIPSALEALERSSRTEGRGR